MTTTTLKNAAACVFNPRPRFAPLQRYCSVTKSTVKVMETIKEKFVHTSYHEL